MAITTRTATVDQDTAGRVDLIVRELSGSSRSQVRGMVDHGCVSINGTVCASTAKTVAPGDVVTLVFNDAQKYKEKKKKWDDRSFSVIFEDEYLIVVDKSAGTLTIPTDHYERNTLVDRVGIYLSHSRSRRQAWLVHRLDRAVSGLLVFGKHERIAEILVEQFLQRKPERSYIAIVAGVMSDDQGSFRGHLSTGKNLDRFVTAPSSRSEAAVTNYRVLKRMSDATLIELTLETGKRNQIRVHLADADHPVLGDPRYKVEQAVHPRWIRKRIALHASTLGFIHPVSGETVSFESPLPSAMQKFIAGGK